MTKMPAILNQKTQVARLSVFSNSFLILLKVFAGILSGSVSIISEAIHSSMDLLASIIAFFAVKTSRAGNYRFIDFHMEMPPEVPFEQVHDFCSLIESEIHRTFDNVQITIHAEPFEH